MERRVPALINIEIFHARQKTEKSAYPLLTGKTLHQEIAELAHEGKTGELKGLLKNFHRDFFQFAQDHGLQNRKSSVRYLENIPEEADYECVCPANVDLICSNIFMGESQNQIIDYEWMFDFPVPVNFHYVASDP